MKGFTFPTRELISQQSSSEIERANVPRSKFIGAWTRKTTFDAGLLIPFLVDEILPGDHMKYDVTAYVRMATPYFPLFDNQRIDTFFFFVPNRLVWSKWKRFMGEQDAPTDSIAFTVPRLAFQVGGWAVGSVFDQMGLPTQGQVDAGGSVVASALPLRAYMLIWQEWFRDQNIQGVVPITGIDLGDGPDTTAYSLRSRAKTHDYFTSALPWPQKFTAPAIFNQGGLAPVKGIGWNGTGGNSTGAAVNYRETQGGLVSYAPSRDFASGGMGVLMTAVGAGDYPQIYADLSLATGAGMSINAFREAFMIQALLERDARGGTRYTELLKSHFGVSSPDQRLQRPEYIGGGSTPLQLTPIAQTAPSAGVPLGAIGAAATSVGQHGASFAATEHGYVIGLINVKTEISYQQGLARHWSRLTRYDFYWPALAELGEQAILQKELYSKGLAADATIFGYQERWQEYRTRYNEVTGIFRSTSPLTLDAWHLAQKFTTAPVLGTAFIYDIPPMERVLAAGALTIQQQYLANILIRREATRPIPMFGTPVLLGRF